MSRTIALLIAWLTADPLFAGPLKGAVSSPMAGVICDKKAGFCADAQGISMGLTKEYLGQMAEQKMMANINSAGANNFDPSVYTLSNGVACKASTKTCTVSKWSEKVDKAHTQALFGK
jgi:hypothetical protein